MDPNTKSNVNHDRQAIGSWARYLGSGTQAEGKPADSSLRGKLDQIWGPIVGTLGWRNTETRRQVRTVSQLNFVWPKKSQGYTKEETVSPRLHTVTFETRLTAHTNLPSDRITKPEAY